MENMLRQPGFPEMYERVLVPAIFSHWAQALLERARPIGPSDRVLDLGCGTGIVARQLRARLGGGARITGVDANPAMIEMARSLASDVQWHVGKAQELPFPDASFEVVVSQQMLQFVPDRAAAAREIRRVLVPGGRLIASTWRPRQEQPLYETLGTIAERHLGPAFDARFSFGDTDELIALFTEHGFSDATVEIVTRTDRFVEKPTKVAMAAAFDLAALAPADRDARLAAVEADSLAAIEQFAAGDAYAAPSRACFLVARANGGVS